MKNEIKLTCRIVDCHNEAIFFYHIPKWGGHCSKCDKHKINYHNIYWEPITKEEFILLSVKDS